MLKFIFNFFKLHSTYEIQRRMEEQYLAKSHDLVDLERRQRELLYKKIVRGICDEDIIILPSNIWTSFCT